MNDIYYNDLKSVNPLVRSKFYSIKPIEVGTPYTESLTSYIIRLANIHNVFTKDMIKQILNYNSKSDNKKYVFSASPLCTSSGAINGVGKLANYYANRIKDMTLREDIKYLNFSLWDEVIPSTYLMRATKAYCPLCYQSFKDNGKQVYDMLIWALKIIDVCPIHRCRLLSNCPYKDCQFSFKHLNPRELLGYCPKCKRWLGGKEFFIEYDRSKNEIDLQQHLYTLRQVKELLVKSYDIEEKPKTSNIYNALNEIYKIYGEGSYTKLSKFLDIPLQTISCWLHQTRRPNLVSLLLICSKANLSLAHILKHGELHEFSNLSLEYNVKPLRSNNNRRVVAQNEQIENVLTEAIQGNNGTYLSLAEIARQLGVTTIVLNTRFPDLCKKIKLNWSRYLNEQKMERIDSMCRAIEEAVIEISKRGEYPSQSKVRNYIGYQHVFFITGTREIWVKTLNKFGYKPMNK